MLMTILMMMMMRMMMMMPLPLPVLPLLCDAGDDVKNKKTEALITLMV